MAEQFDFSKYQTLCEVGGATALLSTLAAKRHPHLQCLSFDLPQVQPIAERWIAKEGLSDRVRAVSGDFLTQPLPRVDVITLGMVLHDWNLEKKQHLVRLAYAALPPGGAFIAIENLIDDTRRENAFGLMMSLNMLTSSAMRSASRARTSWVGASKRASAVTKSCIWQDPVAQPSHTSEPRQS